eukprot:5845831-Alexandrium_andersonii.AAC.1
MSASAPKQPPAPPRGHPWRSRRLLRRTRRHGLGTHLNCSKSPRPMCACWRKRCWWSCCSRRC